MIDPARRSSQRDTAGWTAALFACALVSNLAVAIDVAEKTRHSLSELTPMAKLHLGKTADWVAVSEDAVWVGTTGPDGVAQIDPRTNTIAAAVPLPGNPCAGLAMGFGGLWVPLCAKPNTLVRVDLRTRDVTLVPGAGPADREGGITVSHDSIWLVIDARSTLARIDPNTLRITQRIVVPRGSLNPFYNDGLVWVSQSTGARVTLVDAGEGRVVGEVPTGPKPRFLDASEGAVWTLNQGDGTLTRIDVQSRRAVETVALHTPGHGGDIKTGHGIVWTSMTGVPLSATDGKSGNVLCQWTGAGGDAVGVTADAIWLTDYSAGDLYRYDLGDALRHCRAAPQTPR